MIGYQSPAGIRVLNKNRERNNTMNDSRSDAYKAFVKARSSKFFETFPEYYATEIRDLLCDEDWIEANKILGLEVPCSSINSSDVRSSLEKSGSAERILQFLIKHVYDSEGFQMCSTISLVSSGHQDSWSSMAFCYYTEGRFLSIYKSDFGQAFEASFDDDPHRFYLRKILLMREQYKTEKESIAELEEEYSNPFEWVVSICDEFDGVEECYP
jgi:hypothetical protein